MSDRSRVGFLAVLALALACGPAAEAPRPGAPSQQSDRVAAIMRERAADRHGPNYRISSGDIVQVNVFGVPELSGAFRVSERGAANLPLVGSVNLVGQTEQEAAATLRAALARSYLTQPQLTLSVKQYQGAEVSVAGGVAKPGVYALHGLDETIADLLTVAGGITASAGTKFFFSPAAGGSVPIEIDLTRLYRGQSVPELSIVVRDGDAILVPLAGEVYFDGWVNEPGSYGLTRGLTLAKAVSRAGGVHFGGSRHAVKLTRSRPGGQRETYSIDYDRIAEGRDEDLYLETGDKVVFAANPLKASLWGIYSFVTRVFFFGVGGNVPTR